MILVIRACSDENRQIGSKSSLLIGVLFAKLNVVFQC
jgi:hypothetical protein